MACPVDGPGPTKTTPDQTLTSRFLGSPAHLTVSTVFETQILPIRVAACLVAGCERMTPPSGKP